MKMTIHAHPPVKTYEYPPHPHPTPHPGPDPNLTHPRSGTSIDPPGQRFWPTTKKTGRRRPPKNVFLNYPVIYKTPNFCSNVQHKKIWPSLADGNFFFAPPLKIVWAPLWVSQGRTFTHTPPGWAPNPTPPVQNSGTPPGPPRPREHVWIPPQREGRTGRKEFRICLSF